MKRKLFVILVLFVFLGSGLALSQEVEEQAVQKVEAVETKAWAIPPDLLKNLTEMITDFNKRFQETVEIYKAGLIATKAEFKGMPMDVVLDLESGVFIDRLEYERLLMEAQVRRAKSQAPVKKDEIKK